MAAAVVSTVAYYVHSFAGLELQVGEPDVGAENEDSGGADAGSGFGGVAALEKGEAVAEVGGAADGAYETV